MSVLCDLCLRVSHGGRQRGRQLVCSKCLPTFDALRLRCTCPGGPELVDGLRHTYAGVNYGELLCNACDGVWEGRDHAG